MTESIKRYPVYENREGSVEFMVENGHSWKTLYNDLLSFFNGSIMKVMLEDDKYHYYEGRIYVEEWDPQKHWSHVTLNYILAPYKLRRFSSLEDWLWDPFNFNIGVIQKKVVNEINVSGTANVDLSGRNFIGRKPICPTFIVASDSSGIDIHLVNQELGIDVSKTFSTGSTCDRQFIFSNIWTNNSISLEMSGTGTVSIDFRSGGL